MINKIKDLLKQRKHPNLQKAFAIDTHLTIDEKIKLYELAKGRNSIAEIGSYKGASAACIGQALVEQNNGTLFCIDTWNNDAMSEGNYDTFEIFSDNTAHVKSSIKTIKGWSTEVYDTVRSEAPKLDMLFIDGDHSYEGVKADWDTYCDLLSSNSLIVMHDWGWAEGVKKVIEEDIKPKTISCGHLPNLWWAEIK